MSSHHFLFSPLSPPPPPPPPPSQALFEDGEEERERILYGLETILKDDGNGLVVAKEFLQPVDFVKESKYCKAVAYPTSLSTIIEKLKNKFYRLV